MCLESEGLSIFSRKRKIMHILKDRDAQLKELHMRIIRKRRSLCMCMFEEEKYLKKKNIFVRGKMHI